MRWLVLALILLWGQPAFSQAPDPEKLRTLDQEEKRARDAEAALSKNRKVVEKEITDLKKQLVKTAKEAAGFEKENTKLSRKLSVLRQEETELKDKIYGDRQALMQLLAGLQRIEKNPPPPLAIRPSDASEAARAEILMSSLSAALNTRAEELNQKLEEAQHLQTNIEQKHKSLSANEKTLSKRREKIAKLVTDKSDLKKTIAQDQEKAAQKVKKLSSEANTLRELIRSFEDNAKEAIPRIKPDKKGNEAPSAKESKPVKLPKGTPKFSKAKGKLSRPITGKVLKKYGGAEKGITVGGSSESQVIAPYAGRVEFAGAFKNYENVVILNVGDGYFILLTGLGETYIETGENIKTGEPIGLLPFKAKGTANLYIELRKAGKTIDPNPWLGAALASG